MSKFIKHFILGLDYIFQGAVMLILFLFFSPFYILLSPVLFLSWLCKKWDKLVLEVRHS